MYKDFYLFPFNKVKQGAKVAIYGAGYVGRQFLAQIETLDYCRVLFFVDRQFARLKGKIPNCDVRPPEDLVNVDFDFVIIATLYKNWQGQIRENLLKMGVPAEKILSGDRTIDNARLFGSADGWFTGISYSQYGEDLLVRNSFSMLGIDKPSYIDVGANSPFYLSNTAMLHKYGSKGINIDANPLHIDDFKLERPEDVNLCIGIGLNEGILPYYMFSEISALNTFLPDLARQISETVSGAKYKVVEVPVTTLPKVIDEHAGGKWPDYMSIDIEGMDFDILQSLDLSNGPIMITAEADKEWTPQQANALMKNKGYDVLFRTFGNITYIRKDWAERMP